MGAAAVAADACCHGVGAACGAGDGVCYRGKPDFEALRHWPRLPSKPLDEDRTACSAAIARTGRTRSAC